MTYPRLGRSLLVFMVGLALGAAACDGGSGLESALGRDSKDAADRDTADTNAAETTLEDVDAADIEDIDTVEDVTEVEVEVEDVTEHEVEDVTEVEVEDVTEVEVEDVTDVELEDVTDVELEDVTDLDVEDMTEPEIDDTADVETGDTGGLVDSVCGPVQTVEDDRYADLAGLEGDVLRALLRDDIDEHTGFDYDQARTLMYVTAGIDVAADGLITCIYTGQTVAADGTRSPGEFSTEHSWPRSDGAAAFPAEGDIHHLFPTTVTSNNRRSNDEFGEVACAEGAQSSCPWGEGGSYSGPAVDGRSLVFEVRNAFRGDIARAHFYFAVRYGLAIPALEEATLRAWHCEDPVDDVERDRNDAIFIWQLNRNPFVDQPQLVERVFDY